jgi:hypothetical protein
MAAQTSVGLALGGFVWSRRLRPWPATALLLVAIALAVMIPVEPDLLRGMGVTSVTPNHVKNLLKASAAMVTVATLLGSQWRAAIPAFLGQVVLWPVTNYIQECDGELAAAHLALFAIVAALCAPVSPSAQSPAVPEPPTEDPTVLPGRITLDGFGPDDWVAAAVGTILGCLACWLVLHGGTNSADEWANTYQAALFVKGRAYDAVPHCSEAFRSFWLFPYMGRVFAQYPPGWPYFMTPFVAAHVAWLAGPASLGVLAAGVARLGRRAAAGSSYPAGSSLPARVRMAGAFAAGALVLSDTVLINGGSRYPHIFEAAAWAWSIEALCNVSTPGLSRKEQRTWGIVLGLGLVLMVATRPGDGATLGLGLFLYFV